jgi:hypothetical protein
MVIQGINNNKVAVQVEDGLLFLFLLLLMLLFLHLLLLLLLILDRIIIITTTIIIIIIIIIVLRINDIKISGSSVLGKIRIRKCFENLLRTEDWSFHFC